LQETKFDIILSGLYCIVKFFTFLANSVNKLITGSQDQEKYV